MKRLTRLEIAEGVYRLNAGISMKIGLRQRFTLKEMEVVNEYLGNIIKELRK